MSRKSSSKSSANVKLTDRDWDRETSSRIVSLFRKRLLRDGKASLARKILFESFQQIEEITEKRGVDVLCEAILNVQPIVEVKPQRRGGSVFQVPVEVSPERGILIALSWIAQSARQRAGRGMVAKLTAEIIDASKKTGNAVRKKEELHKMAEANKALSHYRF